MNKGAAWATISGVITSALVMTGERRIEIKLLGHLAGIKLPLSRKAIVPKHLRKLGVIIKGKDRHREL
jgi:hypothetical protein